MNEARHPTEEREAIRALVTRSARLLDAEHFDEFIALFAADGRYALIADGPELGRTMTWLELARDELAALLAEAPQHVYDLARRAHLVTVDEIVLDGARATARSTFAVFRTTADGTYDDTLVRDGDIWRLGQRTATVQTRMFTMPTPL